jgi:peptidoglycan/LPS O-acetylase OafA/YrhL
VSAYLRLRFDIHLLPQFDVGAAGVDIFFVISGFVMVYASERLFGRGGATRLFLLRRAIRIAPMYWIATTLVLVYLIAQYGSIGAVTGGSSWGYVAASYLFFPAVRGDGIDQPVLGIGWTLIYEAFFYVVFGLLIFMPRRRTVLATGGLLCALVLIALVFGPLPYPIGYWFSPIILEFVIGMALALAYRDGARLSVWAAYLLLAAALAVLVYSWSRADAFPPQAWLRLALWGLPAAAIVAAPTLARTPVPRNAFWKTLAYFGDASYSIYLFHTLTLTLPRILLARWIEPASAPLLYLVAMLLCAVVPGLIIYRFVEKPLTAALRRRIEPPRAAEPASGPSALKTQAPDRGGDARI